MDIKIGYEIEMCTPLNEHAVREFFKKNKLPVKEGMAMNHAGPYDTWGIAYDGSIMPSKQTHNKFELISPIMPVYEGLEVLKTVFDWMKDTGGYTNQSTGFHVGVSINDKKTMSNLDQLKLIILLEEETVLEMFNRQKSHWCRPIKQAVLSTVKERVSHLNGHYDSKLPNNIDELIRRNIPATKAYTANLSKLPKYIEFRAMGDKYSTRYDDCKETILHYVECVKAACDPELHNDIYEEKYEKFLKKVYKQNPNLKETIEKNLQLLQIYLDRDKVRRNWRNIAKRDPNSEFVEIDVNVRSALEQAMIDEYNMGAAYLGPQ